jgi:uncharacterized SAM-binding protein YcdF (DUF218 family)
MGILLLAAVTVTPLPNALFRWSAIPSDVQTADAIVVLGAAVDPDGTLSPESLLRTVRAIALFREGRSVLVAFSGPPNDGGPTEADVRAALARRMGVPSDAVLTESNARTTREEALRIGATLRARNVRTILLVTDSLHMRRARALFEHADVRVFPATADVRSGSGRAPGGRLQLVRDVLGEWLALGYYRIAGYL